MQILRILEMPGHEYSSDNGQYAFSSFIHSLITETRYVYWQYILFLFA